MKFRIGVDASALTTSKTGVGNYIFFYLKELVIHFPDCHFYLYAPSQKGDLEYFSQYSNVKIRVNSNFSHLHWLWTQTTLCYFLIKDRVDLFWSTTQMIPLFQRKQMKVMCTLHDFVYFIYPKSIKPIRRFADRLLNPFIFKHSEYLLPNSYGTAARLKEYYALDHHAIVEPPIKPWLKPIEPTILQPWLEEKKLNYKEYLIAISAFEPRKNFESLLKAYSFALENNPSEKILPLVIMGEERWKCTHEKVLLDELSTKYPQNLYHTGYASDESQWYYLAVHVICSCFRITKGMACL